MSWNFLASRKGKNRLIGIFDSGIGGLTVAKAVMEIFPDLSICYFGDTARTPYGTKSKETVTRYAVENTRFLLAQGAKIIVVACNTASAVAIPTLRSTFDAPIFEVISPAVDMALSHAKAKRIGVIGTRATINSGIYERLITELDPDRKVFSEPCPLLVSLVEEGWLKKPETRMIVKKYLRPLKAQQIQALILGCTHYPILKQLIAHKIGKRVKIVDSSEAVTISLKQFLDDNPKVLASLAKGGDSTIYVSDVTKQFAKTAQLILNRKVELNHADV
ncbi:MAG: glutamate racemase [Desulfatibacillum sp.]|nr:glutamate racemase [Desulfatibacillum sp.]